MIELHVESKAAAPDRELDLDRRVLCSRDRMEAVARRNPDTVAQLDEVSELRNWQRQVLGADFVRALAPHRKATPSARNDSPYRD